MLQFDKNMNIPTDVTLIFHEIPPTLIPFHGKFSAMYHILESKKQAVSVGEQMWCV